ncbi:MAG: acetamidase/formamidase family protein [Nitrososphaerales archaeon]
MKNPKGLARSKVALHSLGIESYHYLWNKAHPPVVKIQPGDSVNFEVNEVTSWQLTMGAKLKDLIKLDWKKSYPLSGPVFVQGASIGDALVVEVQEITTANWGWSGIIPGFGLLPEFRKHFLWIWDLSKSDKIANFKNGLKVPLSPFCGVMGVARKEEGEFEVMPPGKHGGNMDIKHLTVGSKLLLPVLNQGALFSVGDIHSAMGDGEVCVTAIECPGEVKLKFDLIKGANITSPRFYTPKKSSGDNGHFVTTGIASDLMEASRLATRGMIDYLSKEYNLEREEAYILCSVAADLRIHEVVDTPNWVVGLWMPNEVFGK